MKAWVGQLVGRRTMKGVRESVCTDTLGAGLITNTVKRAGFGIP